MYHLVSRRVVIAINKFASLRIALPPKETAETRATYQRFVTVLEDCEYSDNDLEVPPSELYIAYWAFLKGIQRLL
jgi:hypothetical protein